MRVCLIVFVDTPSCNQCFSVWAQPDSAWWLNRGCAGKGAPHRSATRAGSSLPGCSQLWSSHCRWQINQQQLQINQHLLLQLLQQLQQKMATNAAVKLCIGAAGRKLQRAALLPVGGTHLQRDAPPAGEAILKHVSRGTNVVGLHRRRLLPLASETTQRCAAWGKRAVCAVCSKATVPQLSHAATAASRRTWKVGDRKPSPQPRVAAPKEVRGSSAYATVAAPWYLRRGSPGAACSRGKTVEEG